MLRFAWRAALRGSLALAAPALLMGAGSAPPDFAPNPSVGWVAFSGVFTPPPSGPGPLRDDPVHPRVSNDDYRATGQQPTFPMADLSNPILQPWVREVLRQRTERILAGKPAFSRNASCWPAGVPAFLLYPVQPVYFVQSPKEVVMIWQADHQIRHVFLNMPHSARTKPSDYGESIGHYEGDTLVVDTIGLNSRTYIDGYQTPHTEQLHVIERFHMIDGGKTLEVNLHIEDPGAFTMAWDAIQRYHRVEPNKAEPDDPFNLVSSTSAAGPIIEASCAENPNSLFGAEALPVPQALKPDF